MRLWPRSTSPPEASGPGGPGLRLAAGACTDVGSVRTENQDAFGVFPAAALPGAGGAAVTLGEPALFLVADGMGGHEAGGEASRTAVEAVVGRFRADGEVAGGMPVPDRLHRAVYEANAAVWARANADGRTRRMGTTCTALVLADGTAFLGHVGDSRAYRVAGGRIEQLTRDHSLGEELRGNPAFTEVARARRHVLTRALGIGPEVEVDVTSAGPLHPDDRFLLCSDGLEPVPMEEVLRALHTYPPQEAAEWLVALASARGSRDNATAVVVHVLGVR